MKRILPLLLCSFPLVVSAAGPEAETASPAAGSEASRPLRAKPLHERMTPDESLALMEPYAFAGAGGAALPCRIHVPDGLAPGETAPLVLFLHGSGSRGDDNEKPSRHAIARAILEYLRETGTKAFVLAPQCPKDGRWAAFSGKGGDAASAVSSEPTPQLALVLDLLDHALATLPVDRSRVYVVGFSMGAHGTWEIALRRPGLFAAAIPVAGRGHPGEAARYRDQPLWVFHGADDDIVPVSRSRDMVAALRADPGRRAELRYTELPGVKHEGWRPFDGPEAFDWLFAQRRSALEPVAPLPADALAAGWVPQGIAALPDGRSFLVSGYYRRKAQPHSEVFVVESDTGRLSRRFRLQRPDGTPFAGHCGGACATPKFVAVASNQALRLIDRKHFEALPAEAECPFDREIPMPNRASFCDVSDGVLWVGEFVREPRYKTDPAHRTTSADGDPLEAWIVGYKLRDGDFPETPSAPVPDYLLWAPGAIQGMTLLDGTVWLCQTFRGRSTLLGFPDPRRSEPDGHVSIAGGEVPFWHLSPSRLSRAIPLPPMAEDLTTRDGTLFTLFESCATFAAESDPPPSVVVGDIVRIAP